MFYIEFIFIKNKTKNKNFYIIFLFVYFFRRMVEKENENAHTNIRTDSQELCHEYADFHKKGYAREKKVKCKQLRGH